MIFMTEKVTDEEFALEIAKHYPVPSEYVLRLLRLFDHDRGALVRTLNAFVPGGIFPSLAVFENIVAEAKRRDALSHKES